MPNRILKESICVSEQIDELSWYEEVVFYRLIVNCDDYGRFDGRISVIKNRLFTLKDKVTHKQVSDAINKLASIGLVVLYEFEGKPFLYLPTWNEHQSVRAKRSKYPDPKDGKTLSDCNGNHLKSNEIKCPRNPIQYECDIRNPIRESNADILPGAADADTGPKEPAIVNLMLNDKSLYPVTQSQIDHWSELYAAVDVKQELLKMQGWLESNPAKRKTKRGIERFITAWLCREQDRGGKGYIPKADEPQGTTVDTNNPFLKMLAERGNIDDNQ